MTNISIKNRLIYFFAAFSIVLIGLSLVGFLLMLALDENLLNAKETPFDSPLSLLLLILSPYAFGVACRAFKKQPNFSKLDFATELISTLTITTLLAVLLSARWYCHKVLTVYSMPSLDAPVWEETLNIFPKSVDVLLHSFPLNILAILGGLGITYYLFKQLDKHLLNKNLDNSNKKASLFFPLHFFIACSTLLFLIKMLAEWGITKFELGSIVAHNPMTDYAALHAYLFSLANIFPYVLIMTILVSFPKLLANTQTNKIWVFFILLLTIILSIFFSSFLWFYYEELDMANFVMQIEESTGGDLDTVVVNYAEVTKQAFWAVPEGLSKLFLSFPFNILILIIGIPLTSWILLQLQKLSRSANVTDHSIHLINDED